MPQPETLVPPQRVEWAAHQRFELGVMSDLPSAVIPEGGVWSATNMLADRPGMLRLRGSTLSGTSSGVTPTMIQAGALITGTLEDTKAVYGLGATAVSTGLVAYYVVPSTATITSLTTGVGAHSSAVTTGRPFVHESNLIFPQTSLAGITFAGLVAAGGATIDKATAAGTAATITANSDAVTGIVGINASTGMTIGGYLMAYDGASPQNRYLGRVTAITSSSAVRVTPPPSASFTATTVGFFSIWSPLRIGSNIRAGSVGCSFQNRILLANVHDWIRGAPAIYPKRVIFTVLPNEKSSLDSNINAQGLTQLLPNAFEDNNFFEVHEARYPITALVPFSDGELLIFTRSELFRLTGYLETETANTGGGVTFNIERVSGTVGCASENSIQRTPRGLLFASRNGVYLYTGSGEPKPLMEGRVLRAFSDASNGGASTPLGSALIRENLYYVSTGGPTTLGFLLHFDGSSYSWTIIDGNVNKLWDSLVDPTDTTRATIWGVRWFNTASPGTQTGGQFVRLDNWLKQQSAPAPDADGTAYVGRIDTRFFVESDPATIKNFKRVMVEYAAVDGAIVTLSRSTLLPESGSFTTIGNLPGGNLDFTRQTGAFTAVARSTGVAYRITSSSPFEVYSIKHSYVPAIARSS